MTVKQKQCLLYYLGYYTGAIDGSCGAKSVAATKELLEDNGLTNPIQSHWNCYITGS